MREKGVLREKGVVREKIVVREGLERKRVKWGGERGGFRQM